MLTDSDLADMRLQFANDNFDLHRSVLPTLRAMGLAVDDLVRAVCHSSSRLVDLDGPPNRDGDEPGFVQCGQLLVRLWYHRDQPRYIYVEEVSR